MLIFQNGFHLSEKYVILDTNRCSTFAREKKKPSKALLSNSEVNVYLHLTISCCSFYFSHFFFFYILHSEFYHIVWLTLNYSIEIHLEQNVIISKLLIWCKIGEINWRCKTDWFKKKICTTKKIFYHILHKRSVLISLDGIIDWKNYSKQINLSIFGL